MPPETIVPPPQARPVRRLPRVAPRRPQAEPPVPVDRPPSRWKFTGDDLIRMGEAGILPANGRFELLDGEVYELMPPGPEHAFLVDALAELLSPVARRCGGWCRIQNPIRLGEGFDPQSDLAVIRGRPADFRRRFPGPGDTLLTIEVADSSLGHDRTVKLPAYAAAGLAEVWILNIPDRHLELYRSPGPDGYGEGLLLVPGETISPLFAPGEELPVASLLGVTAGGD